MNDLVVKKVDLFGDTVMAAQDNDGQVWAGVKWLCDGLGLTEDQMRNERKKISKDVVLSQGGSNLTSLQKAVNRKFYAYVTIMYLCGLRKLQSRLL